MSLSGTQTVEQQLSPWMEDASKSALARADQAASIGYVPYQGPDVAAFTPMQQAAFDGTNMAAAAYGMPTAASTGLPAPTTYANGMQGYSSYPLYQESLAALQALNPAQYDALMQPFVGYQPTSQAAMSQPMTQPTGQPKPPPQSVDGKVYGSPGNYYYYDGKQFVGM